MTSEPSLTSSQQFGVLDQMLRRALLPLLRETDVVHEWIAEMLFASLHSRRGNASEMMAACALALSGDGDPLLRLERAGLDRTHAFCLLQRAQVEYELLQRAEIVLLTSADAATRRRHALIVDRARCRLRSTSPRLVPALRASAYWYDHAARWRNSIVDHYARMLMRNAHRMSTTSGGRVEWMPTYHDSYVAATNAAHRYRTGGPTFAGYLAGSQRGAYRLAASHSLGLAAPGARVSSAAALQTTVMDAVVEVAGHDAAPDQDVDASVLRALVVASRDPDVRAALQISGASPVEALRAMGLGPLGKPHDDQGDSNAGI